MKDKNQITLAKAIIEMESIGYKSLFRFLIDEIKDSKKEELSYNELDKFTENENYKIIQGFLYENQGLHTLSALDMIFEVEEAPNSFANNDYGRSEFSIDKPSNKILSSELIEELTKLVNFEDSEEGLQDQIDLMVN